MTSFDDPFSTVSSSQGAKQAVADRLSIRLVHMRTILDHTGHAFGNSTLSFHQATRTPVPAGMQRALEPCILESPLGHR